MSVDLLSLACVFFIMYVSPAFSHGHFCTISKLGLLKLKCDKGHIIVILSKIGRRKLFHSAKKALLQASFLVTSRARQTTQLETAAIKPTLCLEKRRGFVPSYSAFCWKIKVGRVRIVKSCSGVSRKTRCFDVFHDVFCCEEQNKRGKPRAECWCNLCGAVWRRRRGNLWMQFGIPALPRGFTAPLEDAGICTVPGPHQLLSPGTETGSSWMGKGREGKEGTSAQSGRKGFSRQLFATLQGAAEAAH